MRVRPVIFASTTCCSIHVPPSRKSESGGLARYDSKAPTSSISSTVGIDKDNSKSPVCSLSPVLDLLLSEIPPRALHLDNRNVFKLRARTGNSINTNPKNINEAARIPTLRILVKQSFSLAFTIYSRRLLVFASNIQHPSSMIG